MRQSWLVRTCAAVVFFAVLLSFADTVRAGNIYLTGHDLENHGGQAGYDTRILDYLRGISCGNVIERIKYKIAIVGSEAAWNWSDSAVLAKPGFGPVTFYDTDDLIAGTASWSDVLANDVLVIMSATAMQAGGAPNLNALGIAEINAHAPHILARFNAGMDLWVNSSWNAANYYGFLPPDFAVSAAAYGKSNGFVATTAGFLFLGLTPPLMNHFSHNRFSTFSSALTVMERHPSADLPGGQAIISLGACNVKFRSVVDHLECYKVKDFGPKMQVVVDLDSAQFGLAEGCKVGKAMKFCVPVKKFVIESNLPPNPFEGQDLQDDRVCYKVTCPKTDRTIDIEDQFGSRKLGKLKTFELCTPARKLPPGELSVVKVNDLDGDGMRDAGEPGVPGWVFTISGTSPPYTASATTDASGVATFTSLISGTYTVTDVMQPGWIPTGPTTRDVTMDPDQHVSIVFTNRQPPPSQIRVRKFKDLDGNGVHDTGEPWLDGWVITLTGPNGNVTATTSNGGSADFFPLLAGPYIVAEESRPGWIATTAQVQSVYAPERQGLEVLFGNRCSCDGVPGSVCGDGVVSACEECDDGGTQNGDGCNECCGNEAPTGCGNGVIESPEECDPPGSTTCPGGALCSAGCTCSEEACDESGPQCDGGCHEPNEVCVGTSVQQCAISGAPCTTNANCPTPGDVCTMSTTCTCRPCAPVCQGGSNPGLPCTTDSHCPGGVCASPPCCCMPDGAPQCTTNADCMDGPCLCP